MEKVNIFEILKYAPRGLKLWSDVFGEVIFEGVREHGLYPIIFKIAEHPAWDNNTTKTGAHANLQDKDIFPCTLWPSQECRCWDDPMDILMTQKVNVGCVVADINGRQWVRTSDGFVSIHGNRGIESLPLSGINHFCYKKARYCSPEEGESVPIRFKACGFIWNTENGDFDYLDNNPKNNNIDGWIKKTVTELSGQHDILSSDRFVQAVYEQGAKDVLNMIKDKLKID